MGTTQRLILVSQTHNIILIHICIVSTSKTINRIMHMQCQLKKNNVHNGSIISFSTRLYQTWAQITISILCYWHWSRLDTFTGCESQHDPSLKWHLQHRIHRWMKLVKFSLFFKNISLLRLFEMPSIRFYRFLGFFLCK